MVYPLLIVTAVLDPASTAWFDEQRRCYFPADRLVVGAHVTLFHHLPGDGEAGVSAELAEVARKCEAMPARITGPRSLGRGVAYDVDCPPLVALRGRLAERWGSSLGGQDRAWRRPHVTVQNKVTTEEATSTLAELRAASAPATATVEGLALWRYLGGPWEPIAHVTFTAPAPGNWA